MSDQIQNEGKIKKVLFNEISFMIAGIGLVSSVIFWVTNPQTQLQLEITKLQAQVENNKTVTDELNKIKNNDLHEVQLRMDQIEERQIEELQAIARIEAILQKR